MGDNEQDAVRDRLDAWSRAVAGRDIERVMAFYAPGEQFEGFDFVPPFIFPSADAFREEWMTFFSLFDEDPQFELRDMTMRVSGDLAIAYGLSHFVGSMQRRATDIWTRQTNVFHKSAGQWLLIHEHVSVPVDIATMQGVTDYVP